MAVQLQNRDITLLVIAAAGSTGLSPVQLQKSVFLIGQSGLPSLPSDFYSFIAYNYGPFNPDIYRDAEAFENADMVVEVQQPSRNWSKYIILPAGEERAKELQGQIEPQLSTYIEEVVHWVKSRSFSELLRSIYAKYPSFRENSVFQD